MAILVTGGAGYVGSHVVRHLVEKGHEVVVLDNLSTGHRQAVQEGAEFIWGDVGDEELVDSIFRQFSIEGVIHLAGNSVPCESLTNPMKYFENNLVKGMRLARSMIKYRVKHIVFSSTAAVYGNFKQELVTEDSPSCPGDVMGESMLMFERMLDWLYRLHGIRYVILRYYNAAGAHPAGDIGEDHRPETHLIPMALQTVLGQRQRFTIFGDNHATIDGTCLRDYVHVCDVASAHALALEYLVYEKGLPRIYNVSTGCGYTVGQVVRTVEEVTGRRVNCTVSPRREEDPSILVASGERIRKELGWKPCLSDLNSIVTTAWNWHRNNPCGYGTAVEEI
ncbi:MAG: UDP-glucose 4-epimerase [Eubacteriales bacterium]|nr:UDP-glucose 4-epimerase [Eubacteriales bacterium]